MTERQHIEAIKKYWDNDRNYYEGEINGEPFKIRINKDHKRNSRNDDQGVHNLSLISGKDDTGRVFRTSSEGKFQMQVDKVYDWQDAEEQILEFFYQIEKH